MSKIVTTHKAGSGKIAFEIEIGTHRLISDEPTDVGDDLGPAPHEILDTSLAACTSLTVWMVAKRKQFPLTDVQVEITHDADDATYRMSRKLKLVGSLTDEQRQYLLGIANKCPVHKTLHKKFEVTTSLV
jgi:putative redox protein